MLLILKELYLLNKSIDCCTPGLEGAPVWSSKAAGSASFDSVYLFCEPGGEFDPR
jgi:hypothetical protein